MLQKLETVLTTIQQYQILDTLTEVVEFYGTVLISIENNFELN